MGTSLLFMCICLVAFAHGATDIKYRYLKAIPCSGSYAPGGVYSEYIRAMRLKTSVEIENGYVKADRERLPSFFLGPERMVVDEVLYDGKQSMIARNIVPVPIRSARDDIEASILAAMETSVNSDASKSSIYTWTGATITDRDRGVYDNLVNNFVSWMKRPDLRKLVYDKLKLKGSAPSPYHLLVDVLKNTAGLQVTGLLIEVADSPNAAQISLGAAVLFSKTETTSEWTLDTSNYKEIIRGERSSKDAKIVACYMDELLGLHFATNLPIVISDPLYNRVSTNGLLEKCVVNIDAKVADDSARGDEKIVMSAPYFDSERDSIYWRQQLDASRARPAKQVMKLSEIRDATTFLKMRISEKRACLRASGVISLPRPREGPRMIDAIMIPLLDEEVAYEILRRLGETKGDYEMAANMNDFESRKPKLARQVMEARRKGNSTNSQYLYTYLHTYAPTRRCQLS